MAAKSHTYKSLAVSKDARGVLTIELNRPDVRNCFNEDVITDLTHAATVDAHAHDVRVVVLKGRGKVFCAGGDLNWMKKSIDLSFVDNLRDTRHLSQMFVALNTIPKPVIGVVQGAAVGGGVGLVAVCDMVVAMESTEFGLSEVRLGIVPACVGPFVISKIGASHARRLFLSGERFNARKALEVGLVHEIVTDEESLAREAERMVMNILQCSPNAAGVAKRLVLELSDPERRSKIPDAMEYVSELLAELRISKEGQEGIRAFLEKRKPFWIQK